MKRFIFTGAPCSGKTSVIQRLKKLGYVVVPESATYLIAAEQSKGILRPWENPDFVDKIILAQKESQMNASGDLQFYDRSPFCTYALGRYLSNRNNFVPSSLLLEEIDRCLNSKVYQNKVFFFENLGFIRHTDARKISYEESLIFEQIHFDVYKQFGFDLIVIPKKSIAERCKSILGFIPNKGIS
jgi:hypothetical protein